MFARLQARWTVPSIAIAVIGLSAFAAPTPPADPNPFGIKPPAMDKDKIVKELPDSFGDVCVGGGGRFLIMHFPDVRKIGIFDVNELKVVHYISVADDNVKFAAGKDKLLIALGDKGVLQKWDLAKFERDVAVPMPVKGAVRVMCMGSASDGPLAMVSAEKDRGFGGALTFIDIGKMKPIEFKRAEGGRGIGGESDNWRAAANGRVFGMWRSGVSPQGLATIVIRGEEYKEYYEHESPGIILPSPDGKTLYTGMGLYSNEVKAMGDKKNRVPGVMVPASMGNMYMTLTLPDRFGRPDGEKPKTGVSIHMAGEARALIHLSSIDLAELVSDDFRQTGLPVDKRIYFIPDAKMIVTLPKSNKKVVVHKFDVEEAVEKADIDYLFVTSQPPTSAKPGDTLTYPIRVKSKKGNVQMKLESGPKGMTLSPNGEIKWEIPKNFDENEIDVIVSITDATKQEVFHTFRVKLEK